jgi:hypothetical protein
MKVNDKRKKRLKSIDTLPSCYVCGKSGLYTQMIDYTVYSIHPKCRRTILFTSSDVKEFETCSVCQNRRLPPTKKELRKHLIDNHTKEALADLIVESIC